VLTGISQRQTAAGATKKFFTEYTFERLNLRADRGLGDVEFDCGFGEAAFLGDCPKIAQVVVIQEFRDSETSFA
jgi:hypothetical protein